VAPEPTSGKHLAALYRPIALRTAGRLAFANLVGAIVVFSYVSYVVPGARGGGVETLQYLTVLLIYVAFAVPIVTLAGLHSVRELQAWLTSERTPTPAEKAAVLDQPYVQTRLSFRAWVGAAVVFTLFGVSQGVGTLDCARIALGIVLGGLTTSAFCFLLVERMHRPAFAAALADGVLPPRHGIQIRTRLMIMWMLGSGVPFVGIILAPTGRTNASRAAVVAPIIVLAVIGLVVGLVVTEISARSVTDPLDELREGLERVAAGDLDAHIVIDDGGELGELEAGYNRMLEGLRERARLADLFGRHVGFEVAKRAIENGVALGGTLRDMSILFVDLIGSTGLAQRRPPDEVVALLNDFFGVIVTVIEQNHGYINRFDGDGALCVFGAPEDDPLHATNALTAARELAIALEVLAARHPELQAGIGVSSGTVVAGNIGARRRVEYTVIGDPANEASRLTDLAKGSPGRVLASAASVHGALQVEQDKWDYVGSVALRGRNELTETYEPLPADKKRVTTAPNESPKSLG
jgi:adenylate cyclase